MFTARRILSLILSVSGLALIYCNCTCFANALILATSVFATD